MKHASRVVDVLRAQSERLALAKPAPQAEDDSDPIARVDDVADSQRRLRRPSLPAFL